MAAKIEWQRHKRKTASILELLEHDKYLTDPTHKDHKGYTMVPGRNYNCTGPALDDLVAAVKLGHTNYIRRKNLLKHRRRTHQLWGEGIFCLGIGCYTTKDEREKIEAEYIRRFFPDAAARAYWHVNEETGNCDLHIIFAWKRPCGLLSLKRTKTGMSKRMQSLDRYAADLLNSNADKPPHRIPDIRTAEDTAKAHAEHYSEIREEKEAALQAEEEAKQPTKKKPKKVPAMKTPARTKSTPKSRSLSAQIARQAEIDGIEDVEARHLPRLLERIGLKILQILDGIITYKSSRMTLTGKTRKGRSVRKPRTGTVRIHDFLFDVLNAQMDIRIERDREMISPEPETPANPETPETPVQPAPMAKSKAKTPDEKAATLEEYFRASLGLTKVSPRKLRTLTEATAQMLNTDGTITSKILKSLSDEQRKLLIPLAEEHAKQVE